MIFCQKKQPSPWLSLVPILVLIGLLFLSVRIFGGDTLGGASQIVLLTATSVCVLISICFCGVPWADIEKAIVSNITNVASALLILLLIGALSGAWMVSGIIPTLIYYGMKVIHPDFYLTSTCIICAIVSVAMGSSWTTVATIGIALAGIGMAQGFPVGWIAGAIISGAYFGDKISPLSDTTILASAVTKTPLFEHIKYMLITTVPSITIALIIYTVAGLSNQAISTSGTAAFSTALEQTYNIHATLLLAPTLMIAMIVRRIPALITLFVSCLLACICSVIFQPHILQKIAEVEGGGFVNMFKGVLMSVFGSTGVETGNPLLDKIVSTRGMSGMMDTIWLILCAMCFGGAMTASGMLGGIISPLFRWMKHRGGMVASTVFSGLLFNTLSGDQYLSIILTGDMFKDIYREKGYESRLLSRTAEDAVTVTSPLVPWNTCGMTQATVLGISTFTYLPYCFFNLISPLMTLLIAALGYRIRKKGQTS